MCNNKETVKTCSNTECKSKDNSIDYIIIIVLYILLAIILKTCLY
jgi:hypothetical protein